MFLYYFMLIRKYRSLLIDYQFSYGSATQFGTSKLKDHQAKYSRAQGNRRRDGESLTGQTRTVIKLGHRRTGFGQPSELTECQGHSISQTVVETHRFKWRDVLASALAERAQKADHVTPPKPSPNGELLDRARRPIPSHFTEGLIDVRDDVVYVLNANREPHVAWCHT